MDDLLVVQALFKEPVRKWLMKNTPDTEINPGAFGTALGLHFEVDLPAHASSLTAPAGNTNMALFPRNSTTKHVTYHDLILFSHINGDYALGAHYGAGKDGLVFQDFLKDSGNSIQVVRRVAINLASPRLEMVEFAWYPDGKLSISSSSLQGIGSNCKSNLTLLEDYDPRLMQSSTVLSKGTINMTDNDCKTCAPLNRKSCECPKDLSHVDYVNLFSTRATPRTIDSWVDMFLRAKQKNLNSTIRVTTNSFGLITKTFEIRASISSSRGPEAVAAFFQTNLIDNVPSVSPPRALLAENFLSVELPDDINLSDDLMMMNSQVDPHETLIEEMLDENSLDFISTDVSDGFAVMPHTVGSTVEDNTRKAGFDDFTVNLINESTQPTTRIIDEEDVLDDLDDDEDNGCSSLVLALGECDQAPQYYTNLEENALLTPVSPNSLQSASSLTETVVHSHQITSQHISNSSSINDQVVPATQTIQQKNQETVVATAPLLSSSVATTTDILEQHHDLTSNTTHLTGISKSKTKARTKILKKYKTVEAEDGKVRFACDDCSSTFTRSSDLRRHVRMVHQQIRSHKCPHCPQMFMQKWHVHLHVEAVHQKLRPFACDKCESKFARKSDLIKHAKFVHDEEKQSPKSEFKSPPQQAHKDHTRMRSLPLSTAAIH